MDESIHVLVVESGDNTRTARSLERADRSISTTRITDNGEDLSWYLTHNEPIDCIVCDHKRSGVDGIATLKRVRRDYPDLPFVLFTDEGSEELLSRAITAGISEYVRRTEDRDGYRVLADRIRELTVNRTQETQEMQRTQRTTDEVSTMLDIDLRRLAGANFVGICLIQRQSFVYVNEQFASIFGYTREEMLSEVTVTDIVHEDDRELVIDNLKKREWNLIDELQYTFRGRRKDGEDIHVEVNGERIANSEPPTILSLVLDVTERKRHEEELERYAQMVNTAGDIVYALDTDGQFTFVNDTAPCLTGYSRDELLGQHVSLVLDESDVKEGQDRIQALFHDADNPKSDAYEITVSTADGTTIPCQTNVTLLTEDNELKGSVGVVRNIKEQKQLQELLESERDQFAALFKNISEPTIQYIMEDGSPCVKAVNPAFEEVFGYSEDRIVGRSLDAVIIPLGKEEEAQELNERVSDGERVSDEVYRQTTDGLRHFRLSNAPIVTDKEPAEGYAIYTDITARKRREVELERQNERLDEFASVVSHDLKQPLGIIYGRLSIIREEYNSHHLDDIEDTLERMETLIENVLTLARQGKIVNTPTPTSLGDVVHDAWEISGSDTADLVIDGPLAEIKADGQRLQELFENLFRNAIEHSGPGVSVTVGMRDGDGFYIEDDGPGIPPKARERVFEHSYSTDDNGTGIGLAIGQAIVEAHGWEITVTEGSEGGARFEVRGLNHFVIGGR
jgi:PAS domain S-box-containing protein